MTHVQQLQPAQVSAQLGRMYRTAYGLCRSREDAEDLVQETCVRVLARPRWVRSDDALAYLLTALRNTYRSQLRTAARRPRAYPDLDTLDAMPDRHTPSAQVIVEVAEVSRAVASLSPDHRDVVVAVDLAGLSYAEAARALGIPEGTVMSRLHRARRRLATALA